MSRELKEEIGLTVNPKNLKFAFMMHKYYQETDTPYFNGYFVVDDYTGEPEILEPNKNAELIWVPIKKLPENLIEDRKIAINNYLNHVPYIEDGWN
ncbi:NUDIX domain-containing protein [Weissella paramesenteroides]|uniref:NUDIX domain-containing protein n=1 Tax=Weissella paramesenteroides TaxID=1249 RepID=UPI00388FEC8A